MLDSHVGLMFSFVALSVHMSPQEVLEIVEALVLYRMVDTWIAVTPALRILQTITTFQHVLIVLLHTLQFS